MPYILNSTEIQLTTFVWPMIIYFNFFLNVAISQRMFHWFACLSVHLLSHNYVMEACTWQVSSCSHLCYEQLLSQQPLLYSLSLLKLMR